MPLNKGIADIKKIEKILKQFSANKLSTDTEISLSNIRKWKSGERSIEKMNLADAITLTEYADKNLDVEIVVWKE